jgi:O-antigen/teichoic acid export membrane protein
MDEPEGQKADAPRPAERKKSMRGRIALGALSLLGANTLNQLIGVAVLGVTARLLTPFDFGVVAYFMVGVLLLDLVLRQMEQSLIRMPDPSDEHIDTVMGLQLATAAISAAVIALLSGPVAALLEAPELRMVMLAMAGSALLLAVRNPRFVLYERELSFHRAAGLETATRLVYAGGAIWLSFLWGNYWAVVVAVLASYVVRGALTFVLSPGRPRPRPRLTRWRDCASFGGWAMVVEFCQYAANSAPQLVIGGVLGLSQVGHYRAGNRISVLLTKQLARPMMQVAYPGLAKIARKGTATTEAHALLNAALLALMLPIGAGLAVVSQDLVHLALGPQWTSAALVISVMAPLRALETMQAGVRAVTLVHGHVKALALRNALVLLLSVALIWSGAQFGFGGALLGAAGASAVSVFATLWMARRYGDGAGFFAPLLASWRSMAASAVMAAAVVALGLVLPEATSESTAILPLAVKVPVGAAVYLAAHFGFWIAAGRPDGVERTTLSMIRRRRG